jgi:hypothetical protein
MRDAWLALVALALASAASSGWAVTVGEPLIEALHELQRGGVRVIFSSQTVPPGLLVVNAPSGDTAEERLRSLLAPHGLGLRPLSSGGWVVIEESAPTPATLVIEVRSDADGTVIRGALVTLAQAPRIARTDRHGRARIANLRLAAYTLSVRAEGYAPAVVHLDPAATRSGDVLTVRLVRAERPLDEVVVQTSRYGGDDFGLGAHTDRTRRELVATPGTDEDLARALQQLPGATAAGFSARTHVRGSRDDETLFRYDGVTLVDPYHLKNFQSLFSAIDPSITESTSFWTGAFPIEFGQRTGAVVDIEPRRVEARTAEIGLSLLNTSLLYGTPFAGTRGTLLVSGRVSNVSHIARWLDRDIGEPEFQDLAIRGTWRAGERTSIAAGLLGLADSVDVFTQSRSELAHADYDDFYAWLRITHDFGRDLRSDTIVSHAGLKDARSGSLDRAGISSASLDQESHSRFDTVREELTYRPSPFVYLRAGAEFVRNAADYSLTESASYLAPFCPDLVATPTIVRAADTSLRGSTRAGYASARWQPREGTTAEIGLRNDERSLRGRASDSAWSVRANVRQRLAPATTLRVSWGQFSQVPWVNELAIADGVTEPEPVSRLTQSNLSIEHVFDAGWLLRAEGYDKREHGPLHYFENEISPLVLLPEIEVDRVQVAAQGARMRGLELTLESDRARELSGWVTYAWSKAEDRIAGRNVARAWDQRHTVQAGFDWSHGRLQLSGILNWHSGWPFTRLETSSDTWTDPSSVTLAFGPRNGERRSAYVALDLRAAFEWSLGRGSLEAALELRNALNDKNVCCSSVSVSTSGVGESELDVDPQYWIGITPILGVRWRY